MNNLNIKLLTHRMQQDIGAILGNFCFSNYTHVNTMIVSQIDTYLQSIKNQRSIVDFKVVCDASNNPPSSNQLNVDVIVRPTLSTSYLQLRTTVSAYDDEEWKFAPPPFEPHAGNNPPSQF